MHDFNNAEAQKDLEVIPDGTIAILTTKVRPGGAGDGGWLRRSKDGQSEGLDCEFTVAEGPYARRKMWTLFTVAGKTEGHAEAAKISGAKLRAMLESARGIRPDDKSDAAAPERRVNSYGDFDGLTFMAKIGVEPAKNGFRAKNILSMVITPDRNEWHPISQPPKPAAAGTASAAPPTAAPTQSQAPAPSRPAWARPGGAT